MSWPASFFIAALSGGLGLLISGLIANACIEWYHVSTREGASGYFMVFMALLGGVVAFFLGLVMSRVAAGMAQPGFFKTLGLSLGSVLLVSGAVLLVTWWRADFVPTIDGKHLELAIEVRGPKDFTLPKQLDGYGAYACVYLPHNRSQPQGKLQLDQARQVDGRWIVTAVVPLQTSSSNKLLEVRFNKENHRTFWFPLRSHPRRGDLEWSKWFDSGWDAGQPEPPPEKKFNLRYRVQLVEPPPPAPPEEDPEEKLAREDKAKFDALGTDAPIQAWFAFAPMGGGDDARRATAIGHITARPNYAAELAALMTDADDDVAKESLYLVPELPQPQPALLAPVAAAGQQIAGMIQKVNVTTAEDDPHYYGAASVSVRFSAWIDAVRALREKSGGDFTPELRAILELSRVRPDSHVMRGDVRRVASYYMKEWANLDPLPGDPPPR